MKKREIFLFIFLLFIILIILPATSILTGKVSVQPTNISIQVLPTSPTLSIISPQNKTYLTNISLLLDYSAVNAENIWYNLDNGDNTTITSSIYFNTSQGGHILYLHANNTYGTTTENVSFIVNSTRFIISYSEYNGSTKGNSTDFIEYTYEDLQNLSGIILENTQHGKINFNEIINSTNDSNTGDNKLDLDTYINISPNRIELNSTAIPNFNKSATLSLYNLTFSNPRILRDGSVCPSTICTEQSYSSETGTLVFNVTHFTVYSAEETPAGAVITGGSGGGRAGKKDFSVDKETLSVTLKQGGTAKDFFIIKNTGNKVLSFTIQTQNIEKFLKVDELSFSLNAGESKMVILDFLARSEVTPALYLGKLIIKAGASSIIEKEILVSIEVESRNPIFDVKVEIPKRFRYLMPGEELISNIKIFNLERERTTDVFVEYIIKDEEENEILYETETIFVETQTSFVKSFEIPKNIKSGTYIFYVRTTYNGEVASSTSWFNIGQKSLASFILRNLNLIGIILGIISTFIILIIILRKFGEKEIKFPKLIKKKKERKGFFKSIFKKKEEKRDRGLKYYKQRIRKEIEKHKK